MQPLRSRECLFPELLPPVETTDVLNYLLRSGCLQALSCLILGSALFAWLALDVALFLHSLPKWKPQI